jgi:phosphoribosylanthranilate isomerase
VPGFRVIKAVPATGQALAALDRWPDAVTLLVDSVDPRRRGGTGRTADWSVAAEMAARRRVILAGGLTAENVAEAIRRVRPFAVDVSSGVEVQPGVKSREKMRALFAAIGRLGPEGGTTGSGEGR